MNQRKQNFDTTRPHRSRHDIAMIMVMTWWRLYNSEMPCSAKAVADDVLDEDTNFPIPSLRTISRMLAENEVPNDGYYLRKIKAEREEGYEQKYLSYGGLS